MLEKKLAMFPLDKIQITDDFWKGYMELVRTHQEMFTFPGLRLHPEFPPGSRIGRGWI